ncbi:MAG TPA: TlpA disulfide reductase family protein [Candidatus Binatia bacterium]|jgi:peroxiredoxin
MQSVRFTRCLILFLLLLLWPGPSWGQSGRGPAVNYKLVPNLEPMKDSSPTPDFSLPDPAGKKVSLKNFRGKLVLLNFWATWCVPCREEMPAMERLYQQFRSKGFTIVAVDVKDDPKQALPFLKELKITYPVMLDTDGEVGLLYGAWGLPATYLIGPKGEGLARLWGPAAWDGAGAKQLIQDLLDGKR